VGLYLSYYLNIASGATIVLVTIGVFLVAFFFAPERGLVWQRTQRSELSDAPVL
jgi:ABC-type Mn2+/Zn2+ transport system permease subunit